jgi:hypothetical protein
MNASSRRRGEESWYDGTPMFGKALSWFIALSSAPLAFSHQDAGAAGSLSKQAVYQVVRSHFGAIKSCYETQRARNPTLEGAVDVGWDVEKDGHVSGARVVDSTMNNKTVESCIVAEVTLWRFAVAPERTVVGRFPFVFRISPPVPPDTPKVTIWVSRAGVIELNGKQADLAAVKAALADLGHRKGAVVYGQDQPEPHPIGGRVVELARQNGLLLRMSSRRDFSDAIGPDGKVRP